MKNKLVRTTDVVAALERMVSQMDDNKERYSANGLRDLRGMVEGLLDLTPEAQGEAEDRLWLTQLQQDLLEDRAAERCQADPIYYGIMDVKTYASPEDYADDIQIYDEDGCEYYTLGEFFNQLTEQEKEEMFDDTNSGLQDDGDGIYIDEDYVFAQFLVDQNPSLHILYVQEVDQIEKNLLFLTRKDADEYMKKNMHHHTPSGRSYAMTAIRSPRYEQLLKLLKSIDWERSVLVLHEEGEKSDA